MAETKVTLKLNIGKHRSSNAKKVLFAEAGKEFVDFLFHIMSLPVGTVVNLLNAENMPGSLGVLYKSVESLSSKHFQPNIDKDIVLKPKLAVKVPLLELNEGSVSCSRVYRCLYHVNYVSHDFNAVCPCGQRISTQITYVDPANSATDYVAKDSGDWVSWMMTRAMRISEREGYVKGVVAYMVMDDLEVKPLSINFNDYVNDFHSFEEMQAPVGVNEAVAILKASLETKAVLTTVFLGKNSVASTSQQFDTQFGSSC